MYRLNDFIIIVKWKYAKGLCKVHFSPKKRDNYRDGWVGRGPILVLIFWGSKPCAFCSDIMLLKVVSNYDSSVSFMSVMGFQKKYGRFVSFIHFLDFFLNLQSHKFLSEEFGNRNMFDLIRENSD